MKDNNWTKLGKIFNVSDNTVRKWARNYKLIQEFIMFDHDNKK